MAREEKSKLVTDLPSHYIGVHWSECISCNQFICTNPFGIMACLATPCWLVSHASRLPISLALQPEGAYKRFSSCSLMVFVTFFSFFGLSWCDDFWFFSLWWFEDFGSDVFRSSDFCFNDYFYSAFPTYPCSSAFLSGTSFPLPPPLTIPRSPL